MRIVDAVRMQARIEQDKAPGMVDQVGRDREGDPALAAGEHLAEIAAQPAAGHGVQRQAVAARAPPGLATGAQRQAVPPGLIGGQ